MAVARYTDQNYLMIDQVLVECCQRAIVQTFEAIFGQRPVFRALSWKPEGPRKYEITGVIGFVQDEFDGTLALGFSRESVLKLMSQFYGQELKEVDEKVAGGVNELINIVYGIVKEHLNDRGFRLQMCLPVTIVGTNNVVFSALPCRKARLGFSIENDPDQSFFLEISVIDRP